MSTIPRPDHTNRPLTMTCEQTINASVSDVYAAWSHQFDRWFAQAGTLSMTDEPGRPYFFYNREDWGRHPHYGRILDSKENAFIEMTWMTGNGEAKGTEGAETRLRIDLTPNGDTTHVRLTHSGFSSKASLAAHAENWPLALDILNQALGTSV